MRRPLMLCALIATLALAGCATLSGQSKDKLRDDTLEGYASTLRWGDFASAYEFVDPQVRAQHPLSDAQKKQYNTVEIAQYDTDGPNDVDQNTIRQLVRISLINKVTQSAYDIEDRQTWHWDAAGKHWWLESGLPDITPPQP